jgi:hypothetical protein
MSNPASVIRTFVPQLIRHHFLLICSPEIRSKRLFVQVTPVPKACAAHQQLGKSAKVTKPSLQQLFYEF